MTTRPTVINDNFSNIVSFSELEISSSADGSSDAVDTGWTEITSSLTGPNAPNQYYMPWQVEAKVSGGTGDWSFSGDRVLFNLAWRVDS
jgi:hypothetical protein